VKEILFVYPLLFQQAYPHQMNETLLAVPIYEGKSKGKGIF
jgi:hypothetical protein